MKFNSVRIGILVAVIVLVIILSFVLALNGQDSPDYYAEIVQAAVAYIIGAMVGGTKEKTPIT